MSPRVKSLTLLVFAIALLSAAAAWQARSTIEPDKTKTVEAPRQSGPKFWKGNLHTHSFWSDGDDFPEMIADWYRRHDYHFLTLSDHNILSEGDKWVATPRGSAKMLSLAIGYQYAAGSVLPLRHRSASNRNSPVLIARKRCARPTSAQLRPRRA